MVRYFYKWFSPAHYTHTVHICRVLPAAVCLSDYIHIHYISMSSIWVRLLLHSVHTAAFVTHLQLPTLTTASCVLPWTFISAHSVLPVWQEMEGQLTRQRRTPAALNAPLSTETCTCFYSSQLFIPSLLRVASWSKRGLLILLAKTRGFPTFHHSPSLVGSCANSSWWCRRDLKRLKMLGLEPNPKFPPSLCCPQPHPNFLPNSLHKQPVKCFSSDTEQSVLC